MTVVFWTLLISLHTWLHFTNPYAARHVVRQPYTTVVNGGHIVIQKHFKLKVYRSTFANLLGYYKSGFLIVQNTWFGSYKSRATTAKGIVRSIHLLRFNPDKPYLISGDQFSVLYPRNLGVFYNTILNPHTAHSKADWQNRQRIYLQSVLYAIDAFSSADTLTTTIVPISPRSVVLTQVHPGSVPSDTLYGILYALDALIDDKKYPDAPYRLQTKAAAKQIVVERRGDLARLLEIYLSEVRDPQSGLVKRDVELASARDGSIRSSSFYDNVVLWKTLQLASTLGITKTSADSLKSLRGTIIDTFWNHEHGLFIDDTSDKPPEHNYSSDWLLALPTGFLDLANTTDRKRAERIVAYIQDNKIDEPLPIKYTPTSQRVDAPWAVRTFVPNYGGDAIWSYWGAEYLTLLVNLRNKTGNNDYAIRARRFATMCRQKIKETKGFPETFNAQAEFLQTPFYKSIRQTGWVVQFEHAEWLLRKK